jgi:hypothetical protein
MRTYMFVPPPGWHDSAVEAPGSGSAATAGGPQQPPAAPSCSAHLQLLPTNAPLHSCDGGPAVALSYSRSSAPPEHPQLVGDDGGLLSVAAALGTQLCRPPTTQQQGEQQQGSSQALPLLSELLHRRLCPAGVAITRATTEGSSCLNNSQPLSACLVALPSSSNQQGSQHPIGSRDASCPNTTDSCISAAWASSALAALFAAGCQSVRGNHGSVRGGCQPPQILPRGGRPVRQVSAGTSSEPRP